MAGLADEIQSFEDRSLQSEFNQQKVERFQLFLLAGVLFLASAELLSDRLFLRQAGKARHGTGGYERCLAGRCWLPRRSWRSG